MFYRRWAAALQIVACWVLPLAAEAKDNTNQGPPGYAEAVAEAVAELDANNFPEAREEFRRAHALFPNARTLRGLGMVEFELRNYAESADFLEQALSSSVKPLEGAMRQNTVTLLDRARRYLGELKLQVSPATATVTLDGTRIDVRPGKLLRLEVGEHTLEASAAGRASERRIVQVNGGERAEVRFALSELASAAHASDLDAQATQTGPTDGSSERTPVYKKWWLWTMVAVVVAGGAPATVLLLEKNRETDVRARTGTNTVGASLQTLRRF